MHDALLALRAVELEVAARHIPVGAAVLELGAGNGWQAHQLAQAGHLVVALDVSTDGPDAAKHHPVALYDGINLPLADSSVGVVFSSNVLEHVRNLPDLLTETRRVLDPSGRAVHVLPSPVWRAWTIAARYPFLLLLLLRQRSLPPNSKVMTEGRASGSRSLRQLLRLVRRAAVEPPHGEFASAFAELHEYSSAAWQNRFVANAWNVVHTEPTGVFYTGYGLLPKLSIRARRRLAAVLGSSCTTFVLEPRAGS
jgi:ubiquinone/menaquinone biosynthesis C-methylase UbiE